MRKAVTTIIGLYLLLLSCPIFSQVKNIGIPLILNFPKSTYNAGTQSWGIIQDKRGMMYFANNDGILEFDGKYWRCYPMPNLSVVRSMCISKDQKIYAGAFNEFGYLEIGNNGKYRYKSLVNYLEKSIYDFGEVWKIIETEEGIIFQSFSHIFLYNGKTVKVLLENVNIQFAFKVEGKILYQKKGNGIYKLGKYSSEFLKGSEIFSEKEIWSILPLDAGRMLIGTLNDGVYVYNGVQFESWNNEANAFLKKNQIFSTVTLSNNAFAFGTIQNGVLITDNKGTILQHIDRRKGLQNNTVLSIFADKNYNLWLGLDNGIDYIANNSAISYLTIGREIGAGYAVALFNNYLYLGTNQGLYRRLWLQNESPFASSNIEKVENIQGQVWFLKVIDGKLFCGHDKGTFIINQLSATKISKIEGVWKIFTMPQNPDVLVEGTYNGLIVLNKVNGSWQLRNRIKGFNESSRQIEIDEDTTIWIGHESKGVFKVKVNKALDSVTYWKLYTTNNGLPSNLRINVYRFDNNIIFPTEHGVYKYNKSIDRFEPFHELDTVIGTRAVSYITPGIQNYFWYVRENEPGVILKHIDGSYSIEKTVLRKLNGVFIRSFENIVQLDEKNVIMSSENGFIHFDPLYSKVSDAKIECFIRDVRLSNDSVIFAGNALQSEHNNRYSFKQKIRYTYNALKFTFVANSFDEINKITYKYKLDGFDISWSDWSTNTVKEYTNIPEGNYVFLIKAKDIFGNESEIIGWKFQISPPWYRSILAYIIYVLVIVVVSFMLVRRLAAKYEMEKYKLEIKQQKELEERDSKHAREVMSSQQEIVKLKNEMLELENERNKLEVDRKKKELASLASQITRKNEILEKIKQQLNKISPSIKIDEKKKLNTLIKTIDQDIRIDEDWERFEKYFDQVHGDFIKRLRDKFPQLTPTDLKLCAYLKMNISSKEIAPLLNISVRSVEVSRYRLRKKLGLAPNDNLIDFMLGV